METVAHPEMKVEPQSPFQLLAAFTEKDKRNFFGRERETKMLYQAVQEGNVVLVYGESGTGKTSLVQCGLVSETKHFNWTVIAVRREEGIVGSLVNKLKAYLKEHADGNDAPEDKEQPAVPGDNLPALIQEIFLLNFQPVLLVFDQFEDLFVFGDEKERDDFVAVIRQVMKMRIPWKMIFVLREDFLAQVGLLEKNFYGLFQKRMRIEMMDKSRCREVIVKSCERFKIGLDPLRTTAPSEPDLVYDKEALPDVVDRILKAVAGDKQNVHLPYLQVFLDTLWKKAFQQGAGPVLFNETEVKEVGDMGNVLMAFLKQKINEQTYLSATDAWKFLKRFAHPKEPGVRNQVKVVKEEFTAVNFDDLRNLVDYFVAQKVLAGCGKDTFELAHQSLVPTIQSVKLDQFRKRLETPSIHGNPYKGLQSFDADDSSRFYGREEAKEAVIEKIKEQNFLVIAGNSGSGKSSLVKAGLFPALAAEEYKILTPVRAGDKPIENIDRALAEIEDANREDSDKNAFVLLIDQYEELITRIRDDETREAVYSKIYNLLEEQRNGTTAYKLKIVITVRADFEPQFRLKAPLTNYWKEGKYMVPPFSLQEIKDVIEKPAYYAGLEFSPPSLVDEIADEVYSSQATGLLPLMSYTLSELYKAYKESGREDHLLTHEDYEKMGSVIGGLQNRADRIYQGIKVEHPRMYERYQYVMQNVILRMVYISAGEFAGRRVLKEELEFTDEVTNKIKEEILDKLLKSHLIVPGGQYAWYEPAHDVLMKSWPQVWEWIDKIGEDGINTRNRLAQAVNDYEKSGKHSSYLWDEKPKLDGLVSVLIDTQNNWLNRREREFVLRSKQKRDEALAKDEAARVQAQEERVEKIKLLQEKKFAEEKNRFLQENYEKEQVNRLLTEQKYLVEQKLKRMADERAEERERKFKRENMFKQIIAGALAGAVALGVVAWFQKRKAVDSLAATESAKQNVRRLNGSLSQKNNDLSEANEKNRRLVEEAQKSAKAAEVAKQAADVSARVAIAEREKALALVAQLNNEVNSRKEALAAGESSRIQLNATIQKLDYATKELDRLNKKLQTANDSLKEQNTAQLLATSKRLERSDVVKAYRLAELAYKKDTFNKEAAVQFNRLSQNQNYFYVKEFDGDDARFSPNGNYFSTYSSLQHTLTLRELQSFSLRAQVKFTPGLTSLSYSPDGLLVLATYKNEVRLHYANDSNRVEKINGKARNIISAGFSPNGNVQKAFILAENGLYVCEGLSNSKAVQLPLNGVNDKLLSARFSADGQRLLCEGVSGTLFIIDAATGKVLKPVSKKRTERTFFDPKGKCFIVYSANGNSIFDRNVAGFDSYGEKISFPNLDKYGTLASVTFSEDSSRLLLAFNNSSYSEQQQIQQKTDVRSFETTFVLVEVRNNKAHVMNTEEINKFMNQGDVALLPDGSSSVVMTGNKLLAAQGNGLIRMFNLDNGEVDSLAGHNRAIRSMSLSGKGDYILTGSAGSNTRLWRYDNPVSLDAKGLLPKLSADDLKKYGENK